MSLIVVNDHAMAGENNLIPLLQKQARRKAYMPLKEEERRREVDVQKRLRSEQKLDCVATYLISCLPMILFGFAVRCIKE